MPFAAKIAHGWTVTDEKIIQLNAIGNTPKPDPGEDFDGFVQAIINDSIREMNTVSEADRPVYFFKKAVEHLFKLLSMNAPNFLIHQAIKRVKRHAKIWQSNHK